MRAELSLLKNMQPVRHVDYAFCVLDDDTYYV